MRLSTETNAPTEAPTSFGKWLVMYGAMLTMMTAFVVTGRRALPLPNASVSTAVPPGTLVCRGTVVSIELNSAALSDEIRSRESTDKTAKTRETGVSSVSRRDGLNKC
jgi:hypothetical protein